MVSKLYNVLSFLNHLGPFGLSTPARLNAAPLIFAWLVGHNLGQGFLC